MSTRDVNIAVIGVVCRSPGMAPSLPKAGLILTKTGRGLIAAPMIEAATILIARRRRIFAVRAEICV
jgi:hypothetical protein